MLLKRRSRWPTKRKPRAAKSTVLRALRRGLPRRHPRRAVSVGGIDLFHETYRPILLQTKMVSSPGILSLGKAASIGQQRCSPSSGNCSNSRETDLRRRPEPLVQPPAGCSTS